MADDIDIEEHDVLDNPRIKNIFPDLTRIKTEIDSDVDEGQFESVNEENSFRNNIKFESEEIEYTRHNNKIILGSKPNQGTSYSANHDTQSFPVFGNQTNTEFDFNNIRIKEEAPDYDSDIEIPEPVIVRRKTILDTEREDENIDYDEEIRDSVVELEDWGPRLQSSSCFCKECDILFPTRNCIDAHRMSAHSFLIALSTNKAKKSTTKGVSFNNTARKKTGMVLKPTKKLTDQKSTARKSTGIYNAPSTSKAKFCNHCNITFPDDTSLIKHLYEILTTKKIKCSDCDSVFSKESELKVHMESHKKLESDDEEDDDGTEFFRCNICGCHFKRFMLYNRHMLGQHSIKDPNLQKVNFQRKCLHCSSGYKSSKYQNRHIQDAHATIYNKKATSAMKSIDLSNSEANITSQIQNQQITHSLIPKAVLFKCHQCQIHFTNCTAAVSHSKTCLQFKGDWKCQQCRRAFKINDKVKHLHQHSLLSPTDRFSVHLTNETVCRRTLCLCPACNSYFHEGEFQKHYESDIHTPKRIICPDCALPIHISSYKTHKRRHNKEKFNRNDFILVDYVTIPFNIGEKICAPVKIPKRKIDDEDEEVTPSKKPKLEKLIKYYQKDVLYYCSTCECCMKMSQHAKTHLASVCKVREYRKAICKLCGLQHTGTNHHGLHANGEKLHDFKFIRLQDRKVINPPIPNYPKCNKCNVNFLNKVALGSHKCGDMHKTCKYCQMKFSDLAYDIHVPFHEYAKRKQNKSTNCATSPKKTQDMPELLKQYELLTETWNILYLCDICDIVCDSYDKVVEHSQDHFNNMQSYGVTIKECQICSLKFDGTCFDKHKELHTDRTITKSSFIILQYSYLNLLTNEWFNIFNSLPKGQMDQIISRSIYRSCRNIKMRIYKDGPPELSLYKCLKCHKFMSSEDVGKHYAPSICCTKTARFVCWLCKRTFPTPASCKAHKSLHKLGKSFRIVVFNAINDVPFNKRLNSEPKTTECLESLNKSHPFYKEVRKSSPLYTYFKCKNCESCILHKESIRLHNCPNPNSIKQCPKCGLRFFTKVIPVHMDLHRIVPKFFKRNIKVILFNPKFESRRTKVAKNEEKEENVAKVYKCRCGIHLTSPKTVEKHLELCSPTSKISTENCSQCGLLFPTSLLVSHLCSHHRNDKYTKFEVEEVSPDKKLSLKCGVCKKKFFKKSEMIKHLLKCTSNKRNKVTKATVYKCFKCDIHYLTTASLYKYHFKLKNHRIIGVVPCDICGLNFTKISLKKHQQFHHNKLKCTRKDIRVHVIDPKDPILAQPEPIQLSKQVIRKYNITKGVLSTININLYDNKLYKCSVCKHHFIKEFAFRSHITRLRSFTLSDHVNFPGTVCSICGLSFSLQTLPRHMYIHHEKLKLNRKDFSIINGLPKHNKSQLKIKSESKRKLKNLEKEGDSGDVTDAESTDTGWNESSRGKNRRESLMKIEKAKTSLLDENRRKLIKSRRSKSKSTYNNTLYKCEICPFVFMKHKSLESHITVNTHNNNGVQCPDCGLIFTAISLVRHQKVQHGIMKLKRKDFRILIGLLKKPEDNVTSAGNVSESNDSSLNTDKNDAEIMNYSAEETNNSDAEGNENKTEPEEMPVHKQVKNFNMSQSVLNKLDISRFNEYIYKCTECSIHFLSLNTLDRHSYKHRFITSRVECDICGYMFSTHTLSRHKYIHHGKMKLTRNDMRVYNKENNSTNGSCDTENDVSYTVKKIDDNSSVNEDLSSIDKEFDDTSSVTTNDNTIKEETPIEVEKTGNDNKTIGETSKITYEYSNEYKLSDESLSRIDLSLYDNYLYKCLKCTLHFIMCASLVKHKRQHCNQSKVPCPDCGLLFTNMTLSRHRYIHHVKLGLTLENFFIVTTDGMNKISIVPGNANTIHNELKPDTNLNKSLETSHMDDKGSLDKIDICKDDVVGFQDTKNESNNETNSKELLNKALQNVTQSETHDKASINIEDIDDKVSENTGTSSKAISCNLYECSRCAVHFLDQASLDAHILSSSHNDKKHTCTVCGLTFSNRTIKKHVTLHHESLKLTRKDFNIVIQQDANSKNHDIVSQSTISNLDFESSADKTIVVDESTNTSKKSIVKLYKCGKCNVFFVAQVTCYKHVTKHRNLDSKEYIECKLCGLQFRITSLHNHISVHHSREFNLENVLIEEYHPVTNGTPRIEIYYAVDKVQSKLVSTTSEKEDIVHDEIDTTTNDVDTGDNNVDNKIVTDDVEVSSQNVDAGATTSSNIEINEIQSEESMKVTHTGQIDMIKSEDIVANVKDENVDTTNSDIIHEKNMSCDLNESDGEEICEYPVENEYADTTSSEFVINNQEKLEKTLNGTERNTENPVETLYVDTTNSDFVGKNYVNFEKSLNYANISTSTLNTNDETEENLNITVIEPTDSDNMDNQNKSLTDSIGNAVEKVEIQNVTETKVDDAQQLS